MAGAALVRGGAGNAALFTGLTAGARCCLKHMRVFAIGSTQCGVLAQVQFLLSGVCARAIEILVFLVLFIFTEGLQKTQFFATILRIEM